MINNKQFTVDTHAHIFIKEGLGWLFRGNFDEPLRATGWKNRFSSKTNAETLEKSGIGLIVAALYAHPLLTTSLKESICKQVGRAKKFIATHPNWILAKNPSQAWQAYKNGKKIMILSLEDPVGIIETEEDIKEFIDKLGIRIVTPIHLGDSYLGGAAFLGGYKNYLFNSLTYFKSLFSPKSKDGIRLNSKSLTEKGKYLIKLLIKHHVWIDLSHSSQKSYQNIFPILKKAGQPILFSHSLPRDFRFVEAGISDEQLQNVKETYGVIGLAPCKDFLDLSKNRSQKNPGSFENFALAFKKVADKIGVDATNFGTDFNGGVAHLPPPKTKTNTSIDKTGFWNIGQEKVLWQALKNRGIKISSPRSRSIEYFIKSWEKVWQ